MPAARNRGYRGSTGPPHKHEQNWASRAWRLWPRSVLASELNGAQVSATLAEVTRGELVESVHPGIVVVADVSGRLLASHGDAEHIAYSVRGETVSSGSARRIRCRRRLWPRVRGSALACASHDATLRPSARCRADAGQDRVDEDALRCGVAPPPDLQEAARITLGLKALSQLQCECSGEHAGMLAACLHLDYPLESYIELDHPSSDASGKSWRRSCVCLKTTSSQAPMAVASRPSPRGAVVRGGLRDPG